jgi:hypothetical protein
MKRRVILLLVLVALYLGSSLVLQAVYGPSFGLWFGEDCWIPDGHSGWTMHGHPTAPAPSVPSVEVPIGLRYLPIFLPTAVLVAFLFTPLERKLDPPGKPKAESDDLANVGDDDSDNRPSPE